MRIIIKSKDMKLPIRLALPNALVFSQLIWRGVGKIAIGRSSGRSAARELIDDCTDLAASARSSMPSEGGDAYTLSANVDGAAQPIGTDAAQPAIANAAPVSTEDFERIHKTAKSISRELRRFIKKHGHFNLVEVRSADGDDVLIRV